MAEPSSKRHLAALRRAPTRVAFLLRNVLSFKMEGDIITGLTERSGSKGVRGRERSLIDFGSKIDSNDDSSKIVAVDIKTLVISLREALRKSDRRWLGIVYAGRQQQQDCDLFCIGFPVSRNREWLAVHPRTLVTNTNRIWQFVYSHSGHQIETPIPPTFWPLMIKLDEVVELIESMKSLSQSTTCIETVALRHGQTAVSHKHKQVSSIVTQDLVDAHSYNLAGNSMDDLEYAKEARFEAMLSYLQDQFAQHTSSDWKIGDTKYQPYTADFAMRRGEKEAIFVEVKMCGWQEGKPAFEKHKIRIQHVRRHPNDPAHRTNFSYTGPRATYFLLEEDRLSDGVELAGGMSYPSDRTIAKRWLFVHRRLIPSQLWNASEDADTNLEGEIDRSCLIDFARGDIVEQILGVISSRPHDGAMLPALEDLSGKTRDELKRCLALADRSLTFASGSEFLTNLDSDRGEEGEDLDGELYALDNVKLHRENYMYQAWMAVQILGMCQKRQTGLLYDWECNAADCRTYAFTPHLWTEADKAFATRYPRRNPVEMFELPDDQDFLLLSFALVRPFTKSLELCAHPFVLDTLHKDVTKVTGIDANRLIVFQMEDAITERMGHWPVYAIPASAIDCDKLVKNHSRWRKLVLRDGEDIEDYRFEGILQLLQELSEQLSICEGRDGHVEVGGKRVNLMSKKAIFHLTNSEGHTWLEMMRSSSKNQ